MAKVFIVDRDCKADYKVCFVDQPYKEKNAQLMIGGELVDRDDHADVKVCIMGQDDNADITITRKHFPR
jgi:hypothetical protein